MGWKLIQVLLTSNKKGKGFEINVTYLCKTNVGIGGGMLSRLG
jgi:hypothetical protein